MRNGYRAPARAPGSSSVTHLRTKHRRLVATTVASLAFALAVACGGDRNGDATPTSAPSTPGATGAVSVLGIWADDELASFEAMVEPWESEPGRAMEFIGTRDITPLLTTRVDGNNPPDVALPAEIGLFQRFAREGRLTPLSACPGLDEEVRANYPETFVQLGTVDGVLYGFFMKADTKATVWYNPRFFADHNAAPLEADATFDDLVALSDRIRDSGTPPWSNGQAANGGTGFPGSDTIQQILINDAGVETYDAVTAGTLPYTDPAVRDAWEKFGRLVLGAGALAQGDGAAATTTPFQDSAYPPFEDPPRAAMVHLGGFAEGFISERFPAATPSEDFNFFPWPGGAVTGGANIAYAFNSEPATCSFLSHIASAQAQEIWVQRGGFTSVNKGVDEFAYPDSVSRALARQLIVAPVFRFDLDDAIGGPAQQAIFQGVVQYLRDASTLDQILASVEAARD